MDSNSTRTANRRYQLPKRDRRLEVDVDNIRSAIISIDADVDRVIGDIDKVKENIEKNVNNDIADIRSQLEMVGMFLDTGYVVASVENDEDSDIHTFTIAADSRSVINNGDVLRINGKMLKITSVAYGSHVKGTQYTVESDSHLTDDDLNAPVVIKKDSVPRVEFAKIPSGAAWGAPE